MPQFISEGAERTLENPTEEADAELVIHLDSGRLDEAKEWVLNHGGSIVESLGHGLMEIQLPETNISDLVETGYIDSIERTDESIEVLNQGN
jgi:hypothetical protein